MNDFKYYAKIEKAYNDGNDWFVQGIASGTELDRDGERMSKSVLEQFASAMPMPLTNAHPRPGEVGGDMGEVVEAKVTDGNKLFIKAKLDADHPMVPYMMRQITKGKRHAFSIEGYVKKAANVFDEKVGGNVTEYMDIKPRAISITTEPSYIGSFMEVVSKSYTKGDNNENNSNETTMKDEKVVTETEQVTEQVTETEAVVETPVEEVKPAVQEVKTEEPAEEVAKVEEPAVEKSYDEATMEEEHGEIKEKVEEAVADALEECEEEKKQDAVMETVDTISVKLDMVLAKLQQLVESDKEVHAQMGEAQKSIKLLKRVVKSIHEDNEAIKDLPLMKKSKIVGKSFEQAAAPKRFGHEAAEAFAQL